MLYLSLFAAGILLSMHCVGMCGGFVALLTTGASPSAAAPREGAAPTGGGAAASMATRPLASGELLRCHLLFHAGRISAYAGLGALAGGLGSLAAVFSRAGRAQAGLLLLAGAVMTAAGLAILGLWRWNLMRSAALFPSSWLRAALCRVLRWPRALVAAPYGALLGLLPCGLIYTMLIRAAAAASPWRGAAVMASFGAGAVPALLLVAFGARVFTLRLRRNLFAVSGLLLLALGGAALAHGAQWMLWAR